MPVDRQYRTYRFCYGIVRFLFGIVHPIRVIGRENIPAGGALVCANHTHWSDPLYLAMALTGKEHLHMIAKKELFANKLASRFLHSIGTIPVDRQGTDLSAVRTAVRYLRADGKVGIFPEGTRTKADQEIPGKVGAVRMAEMAGVPLLPIYVPRDKRLFHRVTVVVGRPYEINRTHAHLPTEAYVTMTEALMDRIYDLKETR